MAKKKIKPVQFTEDYEYTVTPKSKNSTFEYTGTESYTFRVNVDFVLQNGKNILGYIERFQNYAIKSGNNLILKTLFTKDSGKPKIVMTTIKNYFADPAKDYKVVYDSYEYYNAPLAASCSFTIQPNATEGTKGLYAVMKQDTLDSDFMFGTSRNDTITVSEGGGDYVYDVKGNDTYNNCSGDSAYTTDLSGKDTYNVTAQSSVYANDYAGNDKYFVNDDGSYLAAQDYYGNDTYTVNSNGASSADFWVNDYKGNDKYYILFENSGEMHRFNDDTGNDKYYLTNATVDVVDEGGKDRYEIKNSQFVGITDTGKGNDYYEVRNCTNLEYDYNFYIADSNGNETYKLNNVTYNYESYNSAGDNDWAIEDENGNDKYGITNSKYLRIKDEKGKDKYTVSNSQYVYIMDELGSDTYTVKGLSDNRVKVVDMYDESISSNDKYNLSYVDGFYISDAGGNDSYTFKSSYGTITNAGGKKDTLTVTGLKKSDIVFMTNYSKATGCDDKNSLIIYDKTSKNFIAINDFYTDTDTDGLYEGYGIGRIEKIKAGKKVLKNVPKADYFTDTLKQQVGNWLSGTDYIDVYDALFEGKFGDDVSGLIACFENQPANAG